MLLSFRKPKDSVISAMAAQWALLGCGICTLLLAVALLCGQWPIFKSTPMESILNFITLDAYDFFLKFVEAVFGPKCADMILSVDHFCCNRPNPILQVMYLSIVGATHYFIIKSSFSYIPGYYLSGAHRYISVLVVAIGVLLFLLTSFSDPGTVKAENVSHYLSAYPYDNIIFVEKKQCSTCKFPKPARSKHCSICNRCIARFDHHCGWMNTCIGERNTRYFLAFLLWHFLLCLYGTSALVLILAGQLKELKIIHILTVYYGIENSLLSLCPHVMQWLLASYNTEILLVVFLSILSIIMGGFFWYHAHLGCTNTTSNEMFKWQEYNYNTRWKTELNQEREEDALVPRTNATAQNTPNPCVMGRNDAEVAARSTYDKGWVRNLCEILVPLSSRHSFSQAKPKAI